MPADQLETSGRGEGKSKRPEFGSLKRNGSAARSDDFSSSPNMKFCSAKY
jgi:hypothetical protein